MYSLLPGVRTPSPLVLDHDDHWLRGSNNEPLGYAGGQWNLTAYCDNDPVNYTDPSGLAEEAVTTGRSHVVPPSEADWQFLHRSDIPVLETSTHDDVCNYYQTKKDNKYIELTVILKITRFWEESATELVTEREANILSTLDALDLQKMKDVKEAAKSESEKRFPIGNDKKPSWIPEKDVTDWANVAGHRDAFRHAYWSALMVFYFNGTHARKFAYAHEHDPRPAPCSSAMDLYNDKIGIDIAEENAKATVGQLADLIEKAVKDGKMVVFDKQGRLDFSNNVPLGQHGLEPTPSAPPPKYKRTVRVPFHSP